MNSAVASPSELTLLYHVIADDNNAPYPDNHRLQEHSDGCDSDSEASATVNQDVSKLAYMIMKTNPLVVILVPKK